MSACVNVCILKKSPSAIASSISSARFSRIRSAIRALVTITSTAATRPEPDTRQQPLADHAAKDAGEDRPHLLVLLGREELDDSADRLGRVDRVQRGEDEVARLGRLHCRLRRLGVAHLADQDHVGVLAQRPAERLVERGRVEPDLALVDDARPVVVEELDRVLDRDDVTPPRGVDVPDDRGERRRLAGAGRAGAEDETARLVGQQLRRPPGNPSSANVGTPVGITRKANEIAPRWRNPLTRRRGRPGGV